MTLQRARAIHSVVTYKNMCWRPWPRDRSTRAWVGRLAVGVCAFRRYSTAPRVGHQTHRYAERRAASCRRLLERIKIFSPKQQMRGVVVATCRAACQCHALFPAALLAGIILRHRLRRRRRPSTSTDNTAEGEAQRVRGTGTLDQLRRHVNAITRHVRSTDSQTAHGSAARPQRQQPGGNGNASVAVQGRLERAIRSYPIERLSAIAQARRMQAKWANNRQREQESNVLLGNTGNTGKVEGGRMLRESLPTGNQTRAYPPEASPWSSAGVSGAGAPLLHKSNQWSTQHDQRQFTPTWHYAQSLGAPPGLSASYTGTGFQKGSEACKADPDNRLDFPPVGDLIAALASDTNLAATAPPGIRPTGSVENEAPCVHMVGNGGTGNAQVPSLAYTSNSRCTDDRPTTRLAGASKAPSATEAAACRHNELSIQVCEHPVRANHMTSTQPVVHPASQGHWPSRILAPDSNQSSRAQARDCSTTASDGPCSANAQGLPMGDTTETDVQDSSSLRATSINAHMAALPGMTACGAVGVSKFVSGADDQAHPVQMPPPTGMAVPVDIQEPTGANGCAQQSVSISNMSKVSGNSDAPSFKAWMGSQAHWQAAPPEAPAPSRAAEVAKANPSATMHPTSTKIRAPHSRADPTSASRTVQTCTSTYENAQGQSPQKQGPSSMEGCRPHDSIPATGSRALVGSHTQLPAGPANPRTVRVTDDPYSSHTQLPPGLDAPRTVHISNDYPRHHQDPTQTVQQSNVAAAGAHSLPTSLLPEARGCRHAAAPSAGSKPATVQHSNAGTGSQTRRSAVPNTASVVSRGHTAGAGQNTVPVRPSSACAVSKQHGRASHSSSPRDSHRSTPYDHAASHRAGRRQPAAAERHRIPDQDTPAMQRRSARGGHDPTGEFGNGSRPSGVVDNWSGHTYAAEPRRSREGDGGGRHHGYMREFADRNTRPSSGCDWDTEQGWGEAWGKRGPGSRHDEYFEEGWETRHGCREPGSDRVDYRNDVWDGGQQWGAHDGAGYGREDYWYETDREPRTDRVDYRNEVWDGGQQWDAHDGAGYGREDYWYETDRGRRGWGDQWQDGDRQRDSWYRGTGGEGRAWEGSRTDGRQTDEAAGRDWEMSYNEVGGDRRARRSAVGDGRGRGRQERVGDGTVQGYRQGGRDADWQWDEQADTTGWNYEDEWTAGARRGERASRRVWQDVQW